MKLGLLADIHGDVENLSRAIELLRSERVDKFIWVTSFMTPEMPMPQSSYCNPVAPLASGEIMNSDSVWSRKMTFGSCTRKT